MRKFFTFRRILQNKLRCIFFLSLCCSSVIADNLITVYNLALRNDPLYQSAIAEFNAIKEVKNQSVAQLLPQLNLTGYTAETEQDIAGGITAGEKKFDSNGYTLTLTQPIYQKERYIGLEQSDARISEAKATLTDIEHSLLLRVATQYFNVLEARDYLIFAQAEKKAITEQLKRAKQRFNSGLTGITYVHEAQARYDQSVASEIEAINGLAISRESLHVITGKDHSTLSILKKDLQLMEPDPPIIEKWTETALSKNAILIKARKAVDIARYEISRNSAGHYPSLDLVVKYSDNDIGDGSINPNRNKESSVMLQLNIPLFEGGIVNSRTRAAAYRLQRAKELLEQQRRVTIRETRSAYLTVIANAQQAKVLNKALASARVALETTKLGLDVGTRTGVDVLDSYRELYRVNRSYSKALYDYILQTLQLKYAAGVITKNDLIQLNRWLI